MTQDCKNLQRVYMNEWVWISNVGQKQPTQTNFFSLVLFIQPKGFSDDLRGLPSRVSVHFTKSPIWQNGFYCQHFGSVAPTTCCFSWPSGSLQIPCELPFPQHTRDPADAQTIELNNHFTPQALPNSFLCSLGGHALLLCYKKTRCPSRNTFILVEMPPAFYRSDPEPEKLIWQGVKIGIVFYF